jgi:DNA-directed RNA polymerase subunit L
MFDARGKKTAKATAKAGKPRAPDLPKGAVSGLGRPVVGRPRVENGITSYDVESVNVSVMNAIRRVILSEIDCVVIRTEPHEKSDVVIHKNNTRINNEMLKHRLSCIPIHIIPGTVDISNLVVEVDAKSEDSRVRTVTTADFRVKHRETGSYLKDSEVRKMFPPNPITGDFIAFTRLLPKVTVGQQGEEVHLEASLSIGNAKENSAFNVACCCAYQMMPDAARQREHWAAREAELVAQKKTPEEVERERANWYALDGMRHYKEDAFILNLESVGVFEPGDLFGRACDVLSAKLRAFLRRVAADEVEITKGRNTMECHDIMLDGENHTLGKLLEYALYKMYFVDTHRLGFVGFQKFHPHDHFSVIRVARQEDPTRADQYMEKAEIHDLLENAANALLEHIDAIRRAI